MGDIQQQRMNRFRRPGSGKGTPTYDASEEDNTPLTDTNSILSLSSPPQIHASLSFSLAHQDQDQDQDEGQPPPVVLTTPTQTPSRRPSKRSKRQGVGDDVQASARTLSGRSATRTLSGDTQAGGPSRSRARRTPTSVKENNGQTRPEPDRPRRVDQKQKLEAEVEDVQMFVQRVMKEAPSKGYVINKPPVGRPVRILVDGLFDLFNYSHVVQLRQVRQAFPDVHVIAGIKSDIGMTPTRHTKQYEAVDGCKWVDEVIPHVPWVINATFLDEWKIDYVVPDRNTGLGEGLYAVTKSLGKYLPIQHAPGVRTLGYVESVASATASASGPASKRTRKLSAS